MSRRTSIMSDNLKEEIAKELGVYETVKRDGGWQNVSSKDCGNIVTKAIEIANRKVEHILPMGTEIFGMFSILCQKSPSPLADKLQFFLLQ